MARVIETKPYMPTIIQVLEFLISNGPGRTEMELAAAIFGDNDKAYQQRVNQDCRMLVNKGVVERRGKGGPADPFKYFPTSTNGKA